MKHKLKFFILTFLFITSYACAQNLPLDKIHLPPGFKISIYAHVPDARQMALGPDGVVFVGTRTQGKVFALLPNETMTLAKKIISIGNEFNYPNGVAFKDGNLYVGEIDRIIEYKNIMQQLDAKPKSIIINKQLPNKRWHGYRYIKFGPDNWLYVGIGMPCNTCNYRNSNPKFGTIMRMREDGKDLQIYAKGIRNTMGFAWQPQTKVLWFSDNGQDWMGDNLPPDEINRAPKTGMDFGFPFFYGDNITAPDYVNKNISKQGMTPPAWQLPAHVAALGVAFYTGKMFPAKYKDALFLAEHGSWNRSKKIGYQVVAVDIKEGKVIAVKPFAYGWLQGENVWGRPVDVLVMPDGALLVSDDHAGVIYRISYQQNQG
ncbi:MAG: PQQ-dependent sugar dehydrogenase [Pseudomonadota bacterium]